MNAKQLADYRPDDLIPATEMPNLFAGTTSQTWNALRHKGGGPAFIKVCRKVYYRRRDVEAWIDSNRMVRTDTPGPPTAPVKQHARIHTARRV